MLSSSCSATPHFWSRELAIWNVGTALAVEAETKVEAVAVPDTPESQFISILLLCAFVGLTFLSFGVIYLAVKDFQEKRERDKLLKEEQAQEKQKNSKREKIAKPGPRGFGQKSRRR
ncbi:hypothetical protein SUGI_0403580 [Cryptomeria japonica]|nr:hypothetical protein SUGI_0403580 [Cryptomeria japonica]